MNSIEFINGIFLRYQEKSDEFYLFRGNMIIRDGIITSFYSGKPKDNNLTKIDLNNNLVVPALKNAHIHLGETIFAPLKGKWSLENYLKYTEYYNYSFGELKEDYWLYSAIDTINKCILNGVSNICTARGTDILSKTNLKCNCGYPIMMTNKLKHYVFSGIEGYNNFLANLSNNIIPGVFLHSLYTNNELSLNLATECYKLSRFITVHVAETATTENQVKESWKGLSSVEILNRNNLLSRNTILVHGGLLSNNDLSLIAKNNCSLVICPISNSKLKTRCIDPNILKQYNIRWSLGTDGLATGRTANLFEHTKFLKSRFNVTSKEALKSITFYASDVLNYNANKYLDVGYECDFIVLNTKQVSSLSTVNEILDDITSNKFKILELYINGSLQNTLKKPNLSITFNNKHESNWK